MSGRPPADLRARHRTTTIIAVAMIAAVGAYWVLIEVIARLGVMTRYPLADKPWFAYLLLAVGVVVVGVMAPLTRRSILAGGAGDPGARLHAAGIATLALAETPGTFALVAFLTTGLREAAYPLLVLSFLAHAVYFPRWSRWEQWAREAGAMPAR